MRIKVILPLCLVLMAMLPARAQSRLDKMSLEEKARCVVGIKREQFPPTNKGICARTAPFPSYGIPTLALADGSSGVRLSRRETLRATAFPSNMALASSWDPSVVGEVGSAAGYEARGYDIHVFLSPGMNIIRNPLCGRDFEYFSEDPLITGKMAAAYVRGVQANGVAACIKHFTCNNQETNRSHVNALVGERALREIYLKGYEICVREASPWSLMTSYNSLNGLPVQENHDLVNGILRGEWGFDGLIMTDWSISDHNTAAQLHAGNDFFTPGSEKQMQDIIGGVKDGSIDIRDLDRACNNVVRLCERTASGGSVPAPDLGKGAAVSKKAACEGAVLLENRGMLPLEARGNAALFGVRSYNLVAVGNGSAFVVPPHVIQINDAFRSAGIGLDKELEDLYLKWVAFSSADIALNEKVKIQIGLPLLPELELSRTLIDRVAERNDYAVLTLGRTSSEGMDRSLQDDFYLSETEKNLLENVCESFHAKGKKVVVVLNLAGMIGMESWKELPDAILNVWLPGQEGGEAVFDLLTGKANPSGRLAVSMTSDYFDYPSARDFPYDHPEEGRNYDETRYTEGIYVGYRHFCTRGVRVAYPFGYGLSYTDFSYSKLNIKRKNGKLFVSFAVTNSGQVAGREAYGVYVSAPGGGLDKPAEELKAFGKTALLAPGATEQVRLEIPVSSLSSYNEAAGKWETARGQYLIRIGANVDEPRLSGNFRK